MNESGLYMSGLIAVITIERLGEEPPLWRRLLRRKCKPQILSRQVIDATQSFSRKFVDDVIVGKDAQLHGYKYIPQPSYTVDKKFWRAAGSRSFEE